MRQMAIAARTFRGIPNHPVTTRSRNSQSQCVGCNLHLSTMQHELRSTWNLPVYLQKRHLLRLQLGHDCEIPIVQMTRDWHVKENKEKPFRLEGPASSTCNCNPRRRSTCIHQICDSIQPLIAQDCGWRVRSSPCAAIRLMPQTKQPALSTTTWLGSSQIAELKGQGGHASAEVEDPVSQTLSYS